MRASAQSIGVARVSKGCGKEEVGGEDGVERETNVGEARRGASGAVSSRSSMHLKRAWRVEVDILGEEEVGREGERVRWIGGKVRAGCGRRKRGRRERAGAQQIASIGMRPDQGAMWGDPAHDDQGSTCCPGRVRHASSECSHFRPPPPPLTPSRLPSRLISHEQQGLTHRVRCGSRVTSRDLGGVGSRRR